MRERRLFIVAKEHSKSPEEVRRWSDYDVERAWLYLTVESEQEFTPDDVKLAKEKQVMAAKPGFILDCDYSHWQKFVTGGQLDAEKLTAGGYTEGQHGYIADEMAKLGWLGEPDEPERVTTELVEPDAAEV